MERVRCAHCRDVIGVYEPLRLMLGDGTELSGSLLTLGAQLEQPGSTALYEYCYRDLAKRSEDVRASSDGRRLLLAPIRLAPMLGSARRGFRRCADP